MKLNTSIIAILVLSFLLTGCFAFSPKKCKMQGCQVRMVHAHGGQEFRGQPFWKRNQNPKIGQDFKPGKDMSPK